MDQISSGMASPAAGSDVPTETPAGETKPPSTDTAAGSDVPTETPAGDTQPPSIVIAAGSDVPTETPAGDTQPPSTDTAAGSDVPTETPVGETQPPSTDTAAGSDVPTETPAGDTQPPSTDTAAGSDVPTETPAGDTQPPSTDTAAGSDVPTETPVGETKPPSKGTVAKWIRFLIPRTGSADPSSTAPAEVSSQPPENSAATSMKDGPLTASEDVTINGRIRFNKSQVLGKGADGTRVYRGILMTTNVPGTSSFTGSRSVAVKRLYRDGYKNIAREVGHLIKLDSNPNIIKYYHKEEKDEYCYIALELAIGSLKDYVTQRNPSGWPKLDDTCVLEQAALGLDWLHSKNIVHRDIKPSNILLVEAGNVVVAKLSDFDLSKELSADRRSITMTGAVGTRGWMAPEVLQDDDNRKTTAASDVFSFGCVVYFLLSGGKHPFGGGRLIDLEHNIKHHEYSLTAVEDVTATARSLVEDMIQHDPKKRLTSAAVLRHPFFWRLKKTMDFIQAASDHIPTDKKKRGDNQLSQGLNVDAHMVLGGTSDNTKSWKEVIDTGLDRGHCKTYGDDIVELLRLVRNKLHHFRDVSEEARGAMGNKPEDFMGYILKKFPNLLLHVWRAAYENVRDDPIFQDYFTSDFKFRLSNTSSETSETAETGALSSRRSANIHHLKQDLLMRVLQVLDVKQLFRARQVCKSWKCAIDKIIEECAITHQDHLEKGSVPVSNLHMYLITQRNPRMTSLQAPSQGGLELDVVVKKCSTLKKADLAGFHHQRRPDPPAGPGEHPADGPHPAGRLQ